MSFSSKPKIGDIKVILDLSIEFLQTVACKRENLQQVHALLLYCAILQTSSAVITLAQANMIFPAKNLLRSMFEIWAQLKRTAENPDYFKVRHHRQLTDDLKVFCRAKEGSPYMARLFSQEDLSKKIIKLIEDIDEIGPELISKGLLPKSMKQPKKIKKDKNKLYTNSESIYKMFEKADLKDEYKDLYSYLSGFTHAGMRPLQNHFLKEEPDGTVTIQLWPSVISLRDDIIIIDGLSGILMDSATRLHDLLDKSDSGIVEKISKETEKIKEHYRNESFDNGK